MKVEKISDKNARRGAACHYGEIYKINILFTLCQMDNGRIRSYSHHMRRITILSFVFFHRRKGIHQRSAIF